jgi:hypothetical protein
MGNPKAKPKSPLASKNACGRIISTYTALSRNR